MTVYSVRANSMLSYDDSLFMSVFQPPNHYHSEAVVKGSLPFFAQGLGREDPTRSSVAKGRFRHEERTCEVRGSGSCRFSEYRFALGPSLRSG